MRRIHFVPALLAATLIAIGHAAPAAAVQSDLTIFIDLDNDASTGCNDPASGFNGYDQKVVTTVNTTGATSAQVTQIEGRNCANAVVFSDGTDHPVGFHNGDNGLNVIETYWPMVASPPPTHPCHGINGANCLRLGVYASNANGGSDTLFTTDGSQTGAPILLILGEGVEIPTLSQWGLLILIVLLACAAALKLRRRPLRALLTVLLMLCAGGIAYAVLGDLDGNTLSEWTPGSRIAHDPSAVDDGDDIASLYARTDPPAGRVFFRIDASLVFNTAPVVTPTAGATTFTEDGPAVVVDSGITVTDADSPNLASATVTITNPQDGALETLAASACAGLTVTPGLNSLSITGSAPPATYQTCFRSVTYNDTSNTPGTTPRTVAFVANDGIVNSAPGNKTVNVAPNDDAPVVTTTAGNTAFTEDGGPVVVDNGVSVSDVDSPNLASATVTITNPQDGASEVLAATACAGLTVTPGLNTLSITGSQPLATYQTCLRSVTFDDTSNNPNTTNRTLSFVVNDGTLASAPANKTVTVTPNPDAPVVTTTAGSTSFTEDGGAVVVDAGVTVTDPDDANLASATVTITNVLDGAAEQLNATSCAGLTVGGGGTSTLNISGSQPLATYQTCLRSVTYNNTDQDPDNTARVLSFVANDGTNSSAPANKTVTVTPVNDAPVVTTSAGTTAFTEAGGPVVVDGGVTVTDVDNANLASATVTITNVLDAGSEQLAATACGGLTVGGSGTATLNISGSATLAAYQTCLRSVTYDNTDQDPDTTNRVISFVANDGTASSAPANKTVSVAAVDNAPVVTTTAGSTAFAEDGGAVTVDSGLTVTDADDANLASATVSITNVQDVGFEALAATSCGGLTVGGSGTPTLNISGSATVAAYQTCLRSVTYNNTDQDPNNTTRVISFVANDGTNASAPANKTVTVAPVNDAPVVTTTGGNTAFTEDGGPVVVDSGLTVTDVDNANLASATVSITNVQDVGFEALAATSCAGLTVGGSGTATLNISGSATLAAYQTCLRSVTYNNTDQDPNNTTRVISFVANDGTAGSAPANKNVTVAPVNDAPVVTTTGGSTSFTEGGGAVVVDSGVTVTDADSANLASATVTITNVLDPTFESLAATSCAGLTVGGSGTATLTITGSQPPATYQTCLQSVTYNNTDLAPDTTNRVISFVANDGALPSNTANKTVTVTAVNSAPVVTTTGGTTAFVEDAGPVVVDSGVTVTDVDSANLASATVTITNVLDGAFEQLNATSCAGLTVGGAGTSTLNITGSQPPATYQTCLRSVTYNNGSNTPDTTTRVISFVASDGAASSAPATKNVSVTPANDAPIVATTAGNTAFTEDGGAVVVDSGVTVVDPDSGNLASATVTITNVQNVGAEALAATACGAFTVGGSGTPTLTITGSQPVATYQTCLQSVTYNNTSQNPTVLPDRVVRFVVNDGALSSNNGDKTVTVAPVNDSPVVTTTAGNTAFVEDAGAVVIDAGVTVTDVDSANLASATVTITNVQDGASEQLSVTACGALTVTGSGTSTLSISGSQTLATYQTCLQSARYNNTSNSPTALPNRVVRFVVNDGAANSNNGDKTVTVTPVNDAPVVTTTGGLTSFTEDGGAVVVDSGVTVSDVDNTNLASATVTITNVQDAGFESLAASACGALTVTGGGTAALSISGSQPLATYQACLQSVTYNNTDQDPAGAPNRIVRFVVNDGTSNSNNGDKTVTVTPVNDAPTVTTSAGTTTFTEDGGAVVVDSALTVADVDNANLASATVAITNVTDAGVETLAATSCGAFTVTGSGTASLSISGSQTKATYQTCLRSVTYNNSSQNPTASPNRIVRFTVNDGALASAPSDKGVVVVPVNDPPVPGADSWDFIGNTELRVDSSTTSTPHVVDTTPSGNGVRDNDSDPAEGNNTTVSALTVGGCTDNSAPFSCTDPAIGTVDMLATGTFTFVPAPGATGAAPTSGCSGIDQFSFTYTLTDDGTPAPASATGTVRLCRYTRVWYVDDAAAGNGTSTSPLNALTSLNGAGGAGDADAAGEYIFLYAGTYAGSLELENNQHLVGQGHVEVNSPSNFALSIPVNLNGNGSPVNLVATAALPQLTNPSGDTVKVTTQIPVEIVGLSLAGGTTAGGGSCGSPTFACNAIDLTSAAALTGSSSLKIANNQFRGAGAEDIDVNMNAGTTGTLTLNVTSNSWDTTGTHTGNAVDVNRAAGTLRLNLSNDTNLVSNNVAGAAVNVSGGAAANTFITGLANNTVHQNSLGAGIVISNATFDADPTTGAIDTVAGGTTTIGAAADRIGGAGLNLATVTGALNFGGDLNIFSDTGAALSVAGTPPFDFDVNPNSADIIANGGPAVAISGADINLQLNSMTSTTTTNGVSLTTVSGTFSAPSGATITKTGAGGAAFNVDNSAGSTTVLTSTYAGTITASGGRSVAINNADSGSSLTFTGAINDTGTGLSLTANTGATMSFRGGLTASTGASAAFTATGGGTLEVCDENPCNAGATGGLVNTLTTGNATALNVANTTISANNLEFRSISAGTPGTGPANGIIVNTTGSSGGLKVKGTGSAGSGGTIQKCTGAGILLTSTFSPSFSWMAIQNGGDDGIRGSGVTNFTLANSSVSGNGDAIGEDGVDFGDDGGSYASGFIGATGTVNITSTTFSSNLYHGILFRNKDTSAPFDQLTLTVGGSGCSITGSTNAANDDGMQVESAESSVIQVSVTGCSFSTNKGDHFQGAAVNNGKLGITFGAAGAGNILTGGHPTALGQGITINAATGLPNPFAGKVTYSIANNTINGSISNAILVNLGTSCKNGTPAACTATATMNGVIQNNTIGTLGSALSCSTQANGIEIDAHGNGTHTVSVTGNTIRRCFDRGILVLANDGNGILNQTITGNTVADMGDTNAGTGTPREAYNFVAGAADPNIFSVPDSHSGCMDLSSTPSGSLVGGAFKNGDIRVRQRFRTRIEMPGYGGTAFDTTAVVNYLQGRNAGSTATATSNDDAGTTTDGFFNTAGSGPCPAPSLAFP